MIAQYVWSGIVVGAGAQPVDRFGGQGKQATIGDALRSLLDGIRLGGGVEQAHEGVDQNGSMPRMAAALSAVARAASGVAPVMVRWPILRPTRASVLP